MARQHMPSEPAQWIICSGGAHNQAMMAQFESCLPGLVRSADTLGWSGAFLEAEAFAFLAVGSLNGQPFTYPGTMGVARCTTGGALARPA